MSRDTDLHLRLLYVRDLADTIICATDTNRCEPAKIDGALEILRDELDSIAAFVEDHEQRTAKAVK